MKQKTKKLSNRRDSLMLFAFMDENTDLGCTVSIDREFSISVHDTEETTYHLHLPLTLLCE